MTKKTEFIVISGLSGSGRSTAIKAFEDLGSYCVDNLPIALLPKILELFQESAIDVKRVVLGMDIREKEFVEKFPATFQKIRDRGVPLRLLFFEASEKVLVRRFSETRRTHPLGGMGSLREAIRLEIQELAPLRALADQVIGTSRMSLRDLREKIFEISKESGSAEELVISVLSFGYKFGLPFDADLVFDVRFLPNPFFIEHLKSQTGLDDPVREYVMQRPETKVFLKEFFQFLKFVVPRYHLDGKVYLTIGIGCTGGRHRSVVIARAVAGFLEEEGYSVSVRNRDIQGE
jgi:UPF0042 nucleotide-binding protein